MLVTELIAFGGKVSNDRQTVISEGGGPRKPVEVVTQDLATRVWNIHKSKREGVLQEIPQLLEIEGESPDIMLKAWIALLVRRSLESSGTKANTYDLSRLMTITDAQKLLDHLAGTRKKSNDPIYSNLQDLGIVPQEIRPQTGEAAYIANLRKLNDSSSA